MMTTDVLIVTYGNRWKYLNQVLLRLIADDYVRRITIINNNSDYNLLEEVAALHTNKIAVIDLEQNTGSAYGFKHGLEYLAAQPETGLILLLDDDNLPDAGCISGLVGHWDQLSNMSKENNTALFAHRPNRAYLRHAAKGIATHLFFPLKNHYLGFHLFRPDIWLMKKIYPRFILRSKKDKQQVSIPCAPYGGLLLHKNLIRITGLPDERFFTYADDFEFTFRITLAGGTVLLLPHHTITDIDTPLVNTRKKDMFSAKFLDMELFRLYFLMRNTMYFTKKCLVTSNFIFTINRVIYNSYIFLLSLAFQKKRSFNVFKKAVKQGLKGDFDNIPPAVVKSNEHLNK